MTYYKRNTRNSVKGELKDFTVVKKSTKLTKVMSFLARYSYYGILTNLKSKSFDDKNKQLFYDDVIFYLEKFGEIRLINLALARRIRLINHYNREQIKFKSLSFRTISRINLNIIDYNKNFGSKINAFVNIGGYADGTLQLPVVFNKHYHGKISDYRHDKTKANITFYIVCFDDRVKHRVRIIIAKDGIRDIPDALDNDSYLGVDVNVKHNLFSTSDDHIIDYDRHIVKDYVKLLKHLDMKKESKKKLGFTKEQISILSKKDNLTYKKAQSRIKDMLKRKSNALVQQAKLHGFNHLVLEDLQLFGKMFSRSVIFEGFKYNRLCRLLNLSDIKNIITGIAHNHGLSVSFVNADYTSQQCSRCGYIDEANRKTQEAFCCLECDYTKNADLNSAKTIRFRALQDVLVKKLLTRNDFNEFIPKKLPRNKLKEIILSHSYNLEKDKTLQDFLIE